MKAFWVLSRLRAREVTRRPSALALFMGMPLLLLGVLALVFAEGRPFEPRVVLVTPSPDRLRREVRQVLEGSKELELRESPTLEGARAALDTRVIAAVIAVEDVGVRVFAAETEQVFSEGLVQALGGGATLQTVSQPSFGYTHYLVPGLMTFILIHAGFFAMGIPMARYRRNHFLKKLAVTPVSKAEMVASQITGKIPLVIVQVALMLGVAIVVFGQRLEARTILLTLGLCVLGLLVFMAAGFVVACWVQSESVIVDLINGVMGPLLVLSGVFFPVDGMVGPVRAVAEALPTTQLVRMLRAVMIEGATAPSLTQGASVLACWALGGFAVSWMAFRWHS